MTTSSTDDLLATIAVDTRRSDFYLEVVLPGEPVTQQSLLLDTLTVGRGDDCELKLEHQTVSRQHGRIERVADRFRIRNLSSSNPIRVDGKNVDEAWLRPGSRISLGDVVLTFRSVHDDGAQPGFVTTLRHGWKALREGASLITERSKLSRELTDLEGRMASSDEEVGRAILDVEPAATPENARDARNQILAQREQLMTASADVDWLRKELEDAQAGVAQATTDVQAPVDEARAALATADSALAEASRTEATARGGVAPGSDKTATPTNVLAVEKAVGERLSAEQRCQLCRKELADAQAEATSTLAPLQQRQQEAETRLSQANGRASLLERQIRVDCAELGRALRAEPLLAPELAQVRSERDRLLAERAPLQKRATEIELILDSGSEVRKKAGVLAAGTLGIAAVVIFAFVKIVGALSGASVDVERVNQAVAMIAPVAAFDTDEGERFVYGGHGTGFAWSNKGYLVTNHHVAVAGVIDVKKMMRDARLRGAPRGEVQLHVFFSREEFYRASVVWADEDRDIAILKLDGDAWEKKRSRWPHLEVGTVKQGEAVHAFGFPGAANLDTEDEIHEAVTSILEADAFSPSFTSGFVSKLRAEGGMVRGADLIQTDADISPGNSGGPLVNSENEVVGLNTFISTVASGVNFSVAMNDVQDLIDREIKRSRDD